MTPRNVLLVTVDSLRADAVIRGEMSVYGRLTQDGVAFEQAYATGPGTTPSFPALLTGTLPLSHEGLGPLADDRPRLSVELSNSGLATGGFQCNPFLSAHFDYDVGFDTYEDYQNPLMGLATKLFPRGIEISNPKLRRLDELLHVTDAIKGTYRLFAGKARPYVSAEVVTDDVVDWLDDVGEPFFCWAHYMDVHHPCFPPEQYRKRHEVDDVTRTEVSEWYSYLVTSPNDLDDTALDRLRALYYAAVEYTNDQIARIVDHLEESGRYDDTLIIFTSDHGEMFGEHGEYGKPERMYDELLHVPLAVANGPDYLPSRIDDLVSLLDIPPLIHDALGLDIPDEYEGNVPGRGESRKIVLAEHEVDGDVIVGARSKTRLFEADGIEGERRLFDVGDGHFERLAADEGAESGVVDEVERRLRNLDTTDGDYLENVTPDLEDRLEDLGYL